MDKTVARTLQTIYDGSGSAMLGLTKLVSRSSTLSRSLDICRSVQGSPETQEMLAQNFLNCYCAGFCAGIDHAPRKGYDQK